MAKKRILMSVFVAGLIFASTMSGCGEVGCDPAYDSGCEEKSSSSEVLLSSSSVRPSSSSVQLPSSSSEVTEQSSSSSSSSSSSVTSSSSSVPSLSSSIDYSGSVVYEGQTYKTVVIGTQTWMAENLNYNASGSKCYGEGGPVFDFDEENGSYIEKTLSVAEVQANCVKYGRLYDWSTAMGFESSCNSDFCLGRILPKHKGICPDGWHIPNDADWNELFLFVGIENYGYGAEDCRYSEGGEEYCSETAGKYLKATTGWNDNGNGIDKYGFSALPGGIVFFSDGSFYSVGLSGVWWSTSESEYFSNHAYNRSMDYDSELVGWSTGVKSSLYSVRCVKD